MRATRPGRGLGWMAGAVGLLVAGRFLRRRAAASLPESTPEEASGLGPVSRAPTAPPDAEAPPSSAGWSLTHEDTAPWEDGEGEGPGPGSLPRIRRGPSGREHFWLEP
ncbi:hypothetical protein [Corallococcus carmarthensis]|uniref:hypothetical protein n=1 Tax=Corallococcus carmarthensis TaxID=2316728 RepID=UPI00148E289C|nr:hypothetical protein [Corallococcus carmarthensis]NOK21906.1 hypothetical protein [Corallococcus carmarthensis]